MLILSKKKLSEIEIKKAESMLITKRGLNINGVLIVQNPRHLEAMSNFKFDDYLTIYEVDDFIINENETLFNYLKDKDIEEILRVLTASHEDTTFSKEILGDAVKLLNCDKDSINKLIYEISELNKEIYSKNTSRPPRSIIAQKKNECFNKKDSSNIELIKYKILKQRATRYSLIKIMKNLKELVNNLEQKHNLNFENIEKELLNQKTFIYLSNKEYTDIYSPSESLSQHIDYEDLFVSFRFKNLQDLKGTLSTNYHKLKNIYLGYDNYILRELSYKDFLKDEQSETALYNMFKVFDVENLNISQFNDEFLEEVISENHDTLKNLINVKFNEFIPEELKPLFNKKDNQESQESSSTNSQNDVLSFLSKSFNLK